MICRKVVIFGIDDGAGEKQIRTKWCWALCYATLFGALEFTKLNQDDTLYRYIDEKPEGLH